jgi:hypothetical protein
MFDSIPQWLGTLMGVAAAGAFLWGAVRTQSAKIKDDTIAALNGLLTVERAERAGDNARHEERERQCNERLTRLEARDQLRTAEFAVLVAEAVHRKMNEDPPPARMVT